MNQTRVIKLSFVILLVSFLLSTIISLVSLHSMAVNNQREMNKVLAAQIYDTISIELGEPLIVSRTMANDYFLIDILKNENRMSDESLNKNIETYLMSIKEGLDFESAFLVSDHSRKYYSYQGVIKSSILLMMKLINGMRISRLPIRNMSMMSITMKSTRAPGRSSPMSK